MNEKPRFAILGAGNGGVATAADLAVKGFHVHLWEHPDFEQSIKPLQELGGINLEAVESIPVQPGFAKLDLITTDIKAALDGVDVVMVIVPAFAHKSIATLCAPHLQDHQVVILSPGNFGGAIQFQNEFNAHGTAKDVVFAEAECMIYACRKKDPTTIWIRRYKKGLRFAALPATKTNRVMDIIHQVYPEAEAAANVLETGLSNCNPTQHPPIVILNAGLLERTGGDFLFYNEGVTHGVVRVIDAVDNERIAICKALNTKIRSAYEQEVAWYSYQGCSGTNLYESMNDNPFYCTSKAPKSFQDRYLTEDIPFGLAPVEELGKLVGIPTPTASAIIQFAELLSERDLHANRRTLADLGLDGMTLTELLAFVNGTE